MAKLRTGFHEAEVRSSCGNTARIITHPEFPCDALISIDCNRVGYAFNCIETYPAFLLEIIIIAGNRRERID
jgi:hypothetical protein